MLLITIFAFPQGLINHETSISVAGGVNAILGTGTTNAICQLQALSPVGRCRTFESASDGYGRSEGFAVAVLGPPTSVDGIKPSHAIIRGSAVNQAGRSSALTAPNGPAQTSLIR